MKEQKKRASMTDAVKNITKDKIYKTMNIITLVVSSGFLVKNIFAGETIGMVAIGLCLGIYCAVLIAIGKMNVAVDTRNLIVSCGLMVVCHLLLASIGIACMVLFQDR